MAGATNPYSGVWKLYQPFWKRTSLLRLGVVALLCSASYFLGIWQHGSGATSVTSTVVTAISCDRSPAASPIAGRATTLDFAVHHGSDQAAAGAPTVREFPACDVKYSEYTPCEDRDRSLRFDRDRLIYRERHCPAKGELLKCLIPAPPGYRNPFPWPASRETAWFANVPHKELTVEKAVQNWIHVDGDKFRFPGGGTMFPNGADAYIDDIDRLISLSDGSIRTAVDTGCGVSGSFYSLLPLFVLFLHASGSGCRRVNAAPGKRLNFGHGESGKICLLSAMIPGVQFTLVFAVVASWGAYLLSRDVLTMSFAPRDSHEAQVQFALERGVPAMIGVLASIRLPYPSRAFDMAHCSRCLIPWHLYGTRLLLLLSFGSTSWIRPQTV
ncbi:hypothetical protein BHM03_00001355 [Ensete ventricosum]|uniref:Methyltransferase n=1 Tax=Ensete ventricosum TaxID=4639 RepID=A0A445M950_ENSVE|nr:hypothetical protein BHM03_00001355 [Ensete ventricosum]